MREQEDLFREPGNMTKLGSLVFISLIRDPRRCRSKNSKYAWPNAEGEFFDAVRAGFQPKSGAEVARFFQRHAMNERGEIPTFKEARDYLKRKHPEIYAQGKAIRIQRLAQYETNAGSDDHLPARG